MHSVEEVVKEGTHSLKAIMYELDSKLSKLSQRDSGLHVHIHLPSDQSELNEMNTETMDQLQKIARDFVTFYNKTALDRQGGEVYHYDPDAKQKLPSYNESESEHVSVH